MPRAGASREGSGTARRRRTPRRSRPARLDELQGSAQLPRPRGGGVLLILGRDPAVESEGLHDPVLLPPGSRRDLCAVRSGSGVMLRARLSSLWSSRAGIDQDLQQDPRRSRCEMRRLSRYDHTKTVGVVRGSELRPPPVGWTAARWRGWCPPRCWRMFGSHSSIGASDPLRPASGRRLLDSSPWGPRHHTCSEPDSRRVGE